ncbi:MAG: GerMN domain-containing protein [Candidatus Paceibacterota bacterium]|jgi:spore germination protein GerM
MNKYLIAVLSIFLLVITTWYFFASRPSTPSISIESGKSIKLYFYNPTLDQGPGGVQCSKNGLVAVQRVIPETTTPLADTIKLLLRGEISDKERASGIESEFPLPDVTLKSATITNGVATLVFDDPQNKTGGGSCRVAILWAQIEATTKQFPTVNNVRFIPEELFQP